MKVWYDVLNQDTDVVLQWRAVKGFRDDIVATLERAGHAAGNYMATNVPYRRGQLYDAIYVTEVKYRPGGAGGGGTWEVEVGVDESSAPHAEFVVEGTGMWNRENPKPAGIWPGTYHGKLRFEKDTGEVVYAKHVSGQHPQRAWFENAHDLAQDIIAHAIRFGN